VDDRSLLSRAAVPAALSALVTLVVQAENLAQRVAPELSASATTKIALLFPFVEWRVIVAAIVVGFVCAYASRARRGAVAAAAIFAAIHLLIAFDQTAFRLFGAHMSIGQMDGGWRGIFTDAPALAGAAVRAGGVVFVVNLLLIAAATFMVWRGSTIRFRPSIATIAYALIALIVAPRIDAHGLDEHPLGSLLSSAEAAIPTSDVHLSQATLDSLRDSTWRDGDTVNAALAAATVRSAYRSPNVVLIVLESVGSEQLLPGGRLSPAVTPRLASLADHAMIFPNIYGNYPATTRAHVPIMTGGRTITWGAVDDELTHRITAPTFVSALHDAGYRTGLFAAPDLRFGSLADFYRAMPWDTVMYYLDGRSPFTKRQEIHSWGVNEDAVRPFAVSWAALRSGAAPFFLEFHTIATHHPYGTWGGDRGPEDGTDDHARYLNSLHYTDAAIGRLLDGLQANGMLSNTIIAITGDHGEAFAEFHTNNTLHRNAIWEENIRNFLILLTPSIKTGAVLPRLGNHGDLMPTVLALAGVPARDVKGQDLLAASYRPTIEYFYKDIAPQQTGLRDGRWKYIEHRDGTAPQLFDLTSDPTEQHNVAAANRARVARYHGLAAAWYVQTNDEFTARLAGWDSTGKRRITHRNLGAMTPPEIAVGHYSRGAGEHFIPTPVMGPNDPLYVLNRWGVLPGDVDVRLAIVSPSHRIYEEEVRIAADWDTSWYHASSLDTGKEPGEWRVSVWRGAQRIAATSFRVTYGRTENHD
jgi:arylsulfatase A-like enzyme